MTEPSYSAKKDQLKIAFRSTDIVPNETQTVGVVRTDYLKAHPEVDQGDHQGAPQGVCNTWPRIARSPRRFSRRQYKMDPAVAKSAINNVLDSDPKYWSRAASTTQEHGRSAEGLVLVKAIPDGSVRLVEDRRRIACCPPIANDRSEVAMSVLSRRTKISVVSRDRAVAGLPSAMQARLTDVTRIYRRHAGKPPFHALGPVSLELQRGRVLFGRRPVGLRQVHAARRARGAQCGERRHGRVRRRSRWRDKVPEGVAVVFQEDATLSVAQRVRQRRVRRAPRRRGRERNPRARGACAGVHGTEGVHAFVSGAALGRHAPARLHCARDGRASASHAARRTLRRARSANASADGRGNAEALARYGRDRDAHHPFDR